MIKSTLLLLALALLLTACASETTTRLEGIGNYDTDEAPPTDADDEPFDWEAIDWEEIFASDPTPPTPPPFDPANFFPEMDGRGIYQVSDRFFATQIHGINTDSAHFLGRTIRMTAMFLSSYWEPTGEYFYFVARFGEGCCAPGDFLGFEIYLNNQPSFPNETWVDFTGILEEFYVEGFGDVLRLVALEITETEEPA